MLRIYATSLDIVRDTATLATRIARRDPDLARQMRRAAMSIALNIAEGSASQGGNRRARYFNALGSAVETRAAIDVAIAANLVSDCDPAHRARLDRVIATLTRLTR
jgi:four helix bundle protein